MRHAILIALVMLLGCGKEAAKPIVGTDDTVTVIDAGETDSITTNSLGFTIDEPCPEGKGGAVRWIMKKRFHDTTDYLDIWLSHNYSVEHWEPRLLKERDEFNKIRAWVKTLDDPCVRGAYLDSLEYYEGVLDKAYKELYTKETKIRQDAYNEEIRGNRMDRERYDVPEPPR